MSLESILKSVGNILQVTRLAHLIIFELHSGFLCVTFGAYLLLIQLHVLFNLFLFFFAIAISTILLFLLKLFCFFLVRMEWWVNSCAARAEFGHDQLEVVVLEYVLLLLCFLWIVVCFDHFCSFFCLFFSMVNLFYSSDKLTRLYS